MRMKTKKLLLGGSLFLLTACSHMSAPEEAPAFNAQAALDRQFYVGTVQRYDYAGSRKIGPAFESLVRRTIGDGERVIKECVWQEGELFTVELRRTSEPLIYEVIDKNGFLQGRLVFEDATLAAWSYGIEVLKPYKGKISGSLADGNGGRIHPDGRMDIRKMWNRQMLIVEEYWAISEDEYKKRLDGLVISELDIHKLKSCRGDD